MGFKDRTVVEMSPWSQSKLTLGKSLGIPWKGFQFITYIEEKQPFMLTFTPRGDLESPFKLNWITKFPFMSIVKNTDFLEVHGFHLAAMALCVCFEELIQAHGNLFVSVHTHECILTAEER